MFNIMRVKSFNKNVSVMQKNVITKNVVEKASVA
jgi:hypothetical protein